MRYPARAVRLALTLCLLASPALAGPWIDPGDTGLRNDLQVLADAGVIGTPLSVWPLSWGDIAAELDAQPGNGPLSDAATEALARVRARARDARVVGRWVLRADASAGTKPWVIRNFEDTPREEGEISAGLEWTGERTAVNLVAQYAANPEDGDELRADGSYAGIALGNWMFAAAATDRWWGPSWQGSLILSNNARPIPAFTIDRNSTAPFETKWLHWLGHWDFITMFGFLEHDRVVPDTKFFGMRFTARPARWLEFGLSRTALWCGEGRPCGLDTFKDLLLGHDNRGVNVSAADEPGDQLAGYDLRLSGASLGVPVAVYSQRTAEDFHNSRPSLFLTQFGIETWGGAGSLGSYRVYLEVSDTLCGGNVYGDGVADCAYNHSIYTTGFRYKERSIGSPFDNDAEVWTLGAMLNDSHDASWLLTLASGNLNRVGYSDPANTVTPDKKKYWSASLVHRRRLPVGEIQAVAGIESLKDPATGDDNQDWRVSLNWHHDW